MKLRCSLLSLLLLSLPFTSRSAELRNQGHANHRHHHQHHHHHHHHDHEHRELGSISRCETPELSTAEKEEVNQFVRQWIQKNGSDPKDSVTVPIHWHLIVDGYGNGEVSNADLVAQLNKLNADFTGTGFQFYTRSITNSTNPMWFSAGPMSFEQDEMKRSLRRGGATHLNVYLNGMTYSTGVLGYATFPSWYGCSPADDGVVVDYTTMPNGAQYQYNEGATLTHEVGHWLGLWHVFEGGCSDADEVADTPAQAYPTNGCPQAAPDTCPRQQGLDNINNFMDYSTDECLSEFSAGQNARMGALWSYRTNPQPCTDPEPIDCFSPNVSINILGKGGTAMRDIAVGDKVLTASGEYKTVFTVSHFNISRRTSFIQIQSETDESDVNHHQLELTPRHMIFVHGKSTPVPASDIKIGDILQSAKGPQKVTKITTVIRNGLYNPVTIDGTIVVGNGILASTYTTYTETSHVQIANWKILSFQTIAEMAYAPYRTICMTGSLELCNQHTEIAGGNQVMKWLYSLFSKQKDFAQFLFLVSYILCFGVINILLWLGLKNVFISLLSVFALAFYCSAPVSLGLLKKLSK